QFQSSYHDIIHPLLLIHDVLSWRRVHQLVPNMNLTFSKRQIKIVNQMKGNTEHGFRNQYLTNEPLKILTSARELNPCGIYVFEPNSSIMTTDSFNRRLKKYCTEAGVP